MDQPISPKDMTIAEYGFKCEVDMTKSPSKDPLFDNVKKFVATHANGCGGVLHIHNVNNQDIQKHLIDKWTRDIVDILKTFVPTDIFSECFELSSDALPLRLFFDKSPEPITVQSNLYTRTTARNEHVNDARSIRKILTQPSAPVAPERFGHGPYKAGTIFAFDESKHIEFKGWKINVFSDFEEKLEEKNTKGCLFSYPNIDIGGDMFIGIKDKDHKIIGVKLLDTEEEDFRTMFKDFLETDPTSGKRRIWADGQHMPVEGRDWWIRFYPVAADMKLIHIRMNHYLGGVFIQEPVSYIIQEDGNSEQLNHKEWRELILASSGSSPELAADPTEPQQQPPQGQPQAASPAAGPSTSGATATSSAQTTTPSKADINSALRNTDSISWNKNRSNWSEGLMFVSKEHEANIDEFASESECLTPCDPLTFTPSLECICSSFSNQNIRPVFRDIQETARGQKGFAIASSEWSSCIPLEKQLRKPSHHLFDVFTMLEDGSIQLSSVAESHACGNRAATESLWEYLIMSSRLTKLKMVSVLPGMMKWLTCKCRLYILNNEQTNTPHRDSDDIRRSRCTSPIDLRKSLANLLMSRTTYIKTCLGQEVCYGLTCQQMECKLKSDISRLNLIEGCPGAGKSFVGFYLCSKNQPEDTAFLCSTRPFLKYLEYLNICRPVLIENDEDMMTWIQDPAYGNITRIVVDDCQNVPCTRRAWHCLFDFTRANLLRRLFMLMDSRWQDFQQQHQTIQKSYISYCSKHDLPPHILPLTVNHRNSKKVCAFIRTIKEEGALDDVACSSVLQGDDIEIRTVQNITEDNESNGVIQVLDGMLDSSAPLSTDASSASACQTTDVAILLDRQNAKKLAKQRTKIINILRNNRSNWNPHDACTFPPQGIRVDTVDNFIGLDAPVIVCIPSASVVKETRKSRRLDNWRYRAYIASRAIRRVIWLTDVRLDVKLANFLKLNKFQLGSAGSSSMTSPTQVVKLWQQKVGDILSVTLLEHGGVTLVVYAGLTVLEAVTISGEPATSRLPSAFTDVRAPISVSVSGDQTSAVVLHDAGSSPSCTVLRREARGWRQHKTFRVSVSYLYTAAVIHDQGVVLVDRDTLTKYKSSGQRLWTVTLPGPVSRFPTIDVSTANNIHVPVYTADNISCYTPTGRLSGSISVSSPRGVQVTDHGLLVVHEEGSDNVISLVSLDGQHRTRLCEWGGRTCVISARDNHLALGYGDQLILYEMKA